MSFISWREIFDGGLILADDDQIFPFFFISIQDITHYSQFDWFRSSTICDWVCDSHALQAALP